MAIVIKDRMLSVASSLAALIWGSIGGACGVACLATGCCGGTVLLGFLSLSGSTLGFLSKMTPVFLALTVLSLGYSFYKAYKPRRADCCETAGQVTSCCDQTNVPEKKHSFLKSKSFLWIITIICVVMWVYTFANNTPQVQQTAAGCCPASDTSMMVTADTTMPCCAK